MFDLTLADASGELDTLGVSGFHKFYSEDRHGWVSTADLHEGEHLRGQSGTMTVTTLASLPGTHRVYNFTVERDHVYYVGDLSTLTHNNGCNLNRNDAVSNFGIYEINVPEGLHKIGKADLNRVTQSSGLPTRLHQQVRKLEKIYGAGNVEGRVVDKLGEVTTVEAKAAETARLRAVYEDTGKVPPGNEKSFKP